MTTKQVQQLLSYLGYDPGHIDGLDGPRTQAALDRALSELAPKQAITQETSDNGKDQNDIAALDTGYPYFSLSEFRCKCSDPNCVGKTMKPSDALLRKLVDIRARFGVPVTISSGIRCPAHNAASGGVATSYHLQGRAADINVRGYTAQQVLAYCSGLQLHYCYAIDASYVHIDI